MAIIDSISNSVHLMSQTQQGSIVPLGLQVSNWVQAQSGQNEDAEVSEHHIVILMPGPSLQKEQIITDIEGHLWSTGWGTVIIVNLPVDQLSWHTNNHMIEIGVKVLTLWHVHTIRWLEMVTGQDVIDVINTTASHPNLTEVCGPDSTVSVFSLVLREVWWVHTVFNTSVSFVPFLVVVLLVVVMGWVNGEHGDHFGELELLVASVEDLVVFGVDVAVAVTAVFGEDLETTPDGACVILTHELELRPVMVTVVSTDFGNLFLVSFDTPEGTDVVSEEPEVGLLVFVEHVCCERCA